MKLRSVPRGEESNYDRPETIDELRYYEKELKAFSIDEVICKRIDIHTIFKTPKNYHNFIRNFEIKYMGLVDYYFLKFIRMPWEISNEDKELSISQGDTLYNNLSNDIERIKHFSYSLQKGNVMFMEGIIGCIKRRLFVMKDYSSKSFDEKMMDFFSERWFSSLFGKEALCKFLIENVILYFDNPSMEAETTFLFDKLKEEM